MIRHTAVWRRRPVNQDNNEAQELTCRENPTNRADGRANHFGIAIRAQVLTLKTHTSLKIDKITAITGVKKSEISNICKRAKERSFDPDKPLQDAFFIDAPRKGALKKTLPQIEKEVINTILKSRQTRTLTCAALSRLVNLSPMSV